MEKPKLDYEENQEKGEKQRNVGGERKTEAYGGDYNEYWGGEPRSKTAQTSGGKRHKSVQHALHLHGQGNISELQGKGGGELQMVGFKSVTSIGPEH